MLNNEELIVLIIDDNINTVLRFKNILKEGGFSVLSSCGYQGYAVAMKERPDIIVMDLLLKHKNGFEILRNLKNSIWTKNIPVFIFSELDTDLCREEAYRLGAAGYMSKPNHFSCLLPEIRAEKSSKKQICSQNSLPV